MSHFSSFPSTYWAECHQPHSAQGVAIVWEKGSSPFFPFLSRQISWQQFDQLLKQTIASFLEIGVKPRQILVYSGSNRLCGLLSYCATIAMGARILMLNPAMKANQQETLLAENGITVLVSDHHFANFCADSTACHTSLNADFEQIASLTLTSGSSGSPKMVAHSMRNHLENAQGVCELLDFQSQHSWLLGLPLFHVSGQGIVWRWLLKGATLVINEDKADFYDCLAQVTHASLVPTQLQRYLEQLSQTVSQKCLLGGSAIPAELVAKAQQFGMTPFSGYGMTEMASTICAVENVLDSVGKPLAGREVQIVNDEIWVRGAGLALGYLQKNGEIRPLVNEEGWLQTKDRGVWNSRGELVVQGRLDNMFISGGENIQPEEIEKRIYQSDLVEQVFILPIADAEFGQRPLAMLKFKQTEADFQQMCNKLQIWLSDRLEKFKHPVAYRELDVEKYQRQGAIKISRKQLMQDLQISA